jgi:hypothetical protein
MYKKETAGQIKSKICAMFGTQYCVGGVVKCIRAWPDNYNADTCNIWGTERCKDGFPVPGKCANGFTPKCNEGPCALFGTMKCVDGVVQCMRILDFNPGLRYNQAMIAADYEKPMFSRENAFYKAHLPEFLVQYPGKELVIVGDELVGIYDKLGTALAETLKTHKKNTFCIKHVYQPGEEPQNIYTSIFNVQLLHVPYRQAPTLSSVWILSS